MDIYIEVIQATYLLKLWRLSKAKGAMAPSLYSLNFFT